MPITKAAKKALRQTEQITKKNKVIKAEIDTLKKNFLKLIQEGQENEAKKLWLKLQKKFDKAAKHNIIKPNTVNRAKSRLQTMFNKKFKSKK
jgi:ribosomal protein S20